MTVNIADMKFVALKSLIRNPNVSELELSLLVKVIGEILSGHKSTNEILTALRLDEYANVLHFLSNDNNSVI